MPEIYLRYTWMSEVCLRYVWHMPEIYLRYDWVISYIYLRYPWDMSEICLRYAWDMPMICLSYVCDMSEICLRYISKICWRDMFHSWIYRDNFHLLWPNLLVSDRPGSSWISHIRGASHMWRWSQYLIQPQTVPVLVLCKINLWLVRSITKMGFFNHSQYKLTQHKHMYSLWLD